MTQSHQEMRNTLVWYGYLNPDEIMAHLAKITPECPIPLGPEELKERLRQDPDWVSKEYYLPGFHRRMRYVDFDAIKARVLEAHDPTKDPSLGCLRLGEWFAAIGATWAEVEAEVRAVDRSYECGCNLRCILAGWRAQRVTLSKTHAAP